MGAFALLRSLRSLHRPNAPIHNPPDSTLNNPIRRLDNPGHFTGMRKINDRLPEDAIEKAVRVVTRQLFLRWILKLDKHVYAKEELILFGKFIV